MEKNHKTTEYLFDFKKMDFVVEKTLEKYLLKGKLKKYNNSFLVVCNKDMENKDLTYNFSLEEIGRIVQLQRRGEEKQGLNFRSFSNPFKDLLQKSQWFSRFNYYEPVVIVSEGKKIYDLPIPCNENKVRGNGAITHYSNIDGIFNAGTFQGDK